MKIIVCDDVLERGEEAIDAIREGCGKKPELKPLFGETLSRALKELFERVSECLPADDTAPSGSLRNMPEDFDCDVLIIDNNLTALDIAGARVTAESIAGYLRAFTKASYIVAINGNPEVDFDLRFLVGDYRTQADLSLNTSHLSNKNLWYTDLPAQLDSEPSVFRPWYWPVLPDAATRREEQVRFVQQRLDKSVLKELGFSQSSIRELSPHAKGAICPTVDGGLEEAESALMRTTFRDFFKLGTHSLPLQKERERLSAGADSDENGFCNAVARIVAADLDRWMRRDVLGPQNVLVDIPHLLMRLPFLLGDAVGELDRWNAAASVSQGESSLDSELCSAHLRDARFPHGFWAAAPCFWWPEIQANETLDELFFSGSHEWPDAVFCEDISRFKRLSDLKPPLGFFAEFEDGTWNRRHVLRLNDHQYGPQSRFLK